MTWFCYEQMLGLFHFWIAAFKCLANGLQFSNIAKQFNCSHMYITLKLLLGELRPMISSFANSSNWLITEREGCRQELFSPAWAQAHVALPASTLWSSGLGRWAWRAARWPRTREREWSTSSKLMIRSSTFAGRTGQVETSKTWVLIPNMYLSIYLNCLVINKRINKYLMPCL